MKHFIAVVSALICFSASLFSQSTAPSIQWQEKLGGTGDDYAQSIQQTTDGGYIVAGYTRSNDGDVTGNHGISDYWIVKLDANGKMIWQKTLGGGSYDEAYSIQQTTDRGYIIAGLTFSNDGDVTGNHSVNTEYADYWIVKLDANGNKLWQKALGASYDDVARSIKQTKDGGYIVAGYATMYTKSNDGDITGNHGISDYWIVKLDTYGNLIWQKSLGGFRSDVADCIQQTTDGGYVVAGYSESDDGSITGYHGRGDYWIVKLDANGNMLWQKAFGGTDSEWAKSIQQTADGGYVVAGYTFSNDGDVTGNHGGFDYWIVKLDVNGKMIWQKTLGGTNYDYANNIQQTKDGGYIISGSTHSSNGDVTDNPQGWGQYWIVKLDASGNITWQKILGVVNNDFGNSIQQTGDEGYIFAGSLGDYWIVKLTASCTPVTPSISVAASPGTSICTGTKVTFIATATNGGDSAFYQWKKNGVNVGTNSKTYADSSLKNGDSIYCVLTSNVACATSSTAKSNTVKMMVNTPITPTVSITASSGTSICTGTKVTFTATATNGGDSAIYQWKKNGINVGTNSKTYVDSTLETGDSLYCVLTSNATCLTTSTAKSNIIKMTVSNPVTPTVSIAVSPGTSVCAGTIVTFIATITNGGVAPFYRWMKNGINISGGNKTFIDTAVKNGDSIYCVLTSNAACATTTAKSNTIKMIVTNPVVPKVSIAVNPGTSVCTGSKVTFTATATNGGTAPFYQWKKNGVNVGTNSNTYIVDTALKNGDSIYCVLNSNAACATTPTVNSNGIKMTVTNSVTPTVSVAASPGTSVCTGTKVTFTATATNGGTAPVYQWKKNGINVGTNSKTYVVDTALKNGDSIYCVITSNASCVTAVTAKSNGIKMTVNTPTAPMVNVTASPGTEICTGSTVTFTATTTNGGTSPIYQWKKNGADVGTNSKTYVDSTLKTGDSLYCVLTSNATCLTTSTAKSNIIKMTVSNPVTPTVSIAVSPGTSVCAGTIVTFTATITNGGTAPFYRWMKNGINISGNKTFIDTAVKNGDSIYCVLTSNATCVTKNIVNSNGIKMTATSPVTPALSIAVSPGASVCAGSKVTFTATATNGGTAPVYQWKKSGINVGTNSKTYVVDTALKNGDSIYCVLTSNASCATTATAKSNVIKMTVNQPTAPTVSITASPGTAVCAGSTVTFTATATNGGTSPIYQWTKNGVSVASNSKTYIDPAIKNGDSIYCILASNASCITQSVVNSNGIKMTVSNPLTPSVSIAANPGTSVCAGSKVTFTATATNGGTSPVYQWKKNGVTVGTNSNTYIVDTALKNGDSIYCVLNSNAVCATTPTVNSNRIKMTVNNAVTPVVSIAVSPGITVCTGSQVTFTATAINGGTSPVYQWKKNEINVGTNSKTYVVDTALKNGDSIYCVLTSNASCITTATAKSNVIKMTVTSPVAPTVSITASPGTAVCTGSTVTFTATATNGGTSPIYQWTKNGVGVASNSKTYIDPALKNGDSIYCTLASNASCITKSVVNSNGIKMTVTNLVTPTVSIAVNPGTSVCAGTKVTFTATGTNGGTTPVYQWKKNGVNVGTNSNTYIVDTALKNSDSIYCVLTSNAVCATTPTANSNGIKMTVTNPVIPTLSIATSPGTSICAGTKVTFTATATNGGTSPLYQWKKNGINVGTNSKTYVVDTALKNGDSIYCVLTSNAVCATTATAKSNGVKMTVTNPVIPKVSIAASPGTSVCAGSRVTFTATIANGGTSPVYQWKKNGVNVGTNSNTYIVDTALKNGDSIYCVLASNASCVTANIVNSNGIKMTVNNPVIPTVSISVSPGTSVCTGNKVTFTATTTNGGTSPVFQWKKNGVNIGTNSNTFIIDTALKSGDSIYCMLTSNAVCATTPTAKSNVLKMTVSKPVTPKITIIANPSTSVCAGSKVTFTATATNGGTGPVYQWKKNGINVGTNSKTYVVDTALKHGDSIYCVLTSKAICATTPTAKSNGIKMIVNNCDSLIAGHVLTRGYESQQLLVTATPNPFKNSVRLTVTSPASAKAVIFITDITGRKVYKQDVLLNPGTNIISVASSHWSAGSYYAQVVANSETQSCKIIKQ